MISQCIIIPRRRDIDLALSVRLFVRPSVTNLLVLYLKDYYRFEHETSEVYRFHWGNVHCTITITLHFLILELLPFVIFSYFLPSVTNLLGLYLKDYYRFEHELSLVYRFHWEVHYIRTKTLDFLILVLLPFVIFHTWILCWTYLSDYKRYQYETL